MILRQRHLRLCSTLCCAVVFLGCWALSCAAEEQTASTASAPAHELRIVSKEFAFSVPPTRVFAGQPVTIVLDNSLGETEHQIVFAALGLRISASAGSVTKQAYTFKRPGEYEFICDLPGHLEAGMKGKLMVSPPEGRLKK
jgi:plastocyanin